MTNGFKLDRANVRCLVYMPLFRWIGDIIHRILDISGQSDLAKSAFPSILWYLGEIWGDFYVPTIVLAILPADVKKQRYLVYFAYSLFAISKVGNCVWRLYAYFTNQDKHVLYTYMAYFDSGAHYAGK